MPISREKNIALTRDLLDNPYPQNPSYHKCLTAEIDGEQDVANALNNTGEAWATDEYSLICNSNASIYEISVENFGKPINVVREMNNPYTSYVPVPFADLSNQMRSFNGGGFYNGTFSFGETVEKMAFFRSGSSDPVYQVQIQPPPWSSTRYLITYLIGYIGEDDPLEATLSIPEHAALIRYRKAVGLLPYAEWYEDMEMNIQKRRELKEGFLYELARKEELFKSYIRNLTIPRTVTFDGDWR